MAVQVKSGPILGGSFVLPITYELARYVCIFQRGVDVSLSMSGPGARVFCQEFQESEADVLGALFYGESSCAVCLEMRGVACTALQSAADDRIQPLYPK